MTAVDLLAFDLDVSGHHASYLHLLARHWAAEVPGDRRLALVVSDELPERHPEVAASIAEMRTVALVPIHRRERPDPGRGTLGRIRHAVAEWRILSEYARRLQARHALAMYFDHLMQAPMVLGLRAACPVSGIYFRPTFHYAGFAGTALDRRDRLRAARQRLALRRIARHPDLRTLFSLDPFAVPVLRRIAPPSAAVVHLPDPVDTGEVSTQRLRALAREHGLGDGERVALLFGALTPRKGLFEAMDALIRLPPTVGRVALCLVGSVDPALRAEVERRAARGGPDRRVILVDRFVKEDEIQPWFELADVVLAPYQKHVGMSGIVVRAAAAARPVVGSDWGLMGQLVREHGLGVAVDAASPEAIARGLTEVLTGSARWDAERMRAFAASNTPARFARVLVEHTRA